MRRTKTHRSITAAALLILCTLVMVNIGPLAPLPAYACPNCNSLMSPDKNKSADGKTANDNTGDRTVDLALDAAQLFVEAREHAVGALYGRIQLDDDLRERGCV